ncbi:disulfide bond formation protein B [Pusillimonas sp. CC-YST705]|uniref:Disulfide bond formation protein B n=1 Tax=Mesopusillimonas faecipullorum TaxID=2755040 RepID=A0ABS8CB90_9BURK|nr:disulfide bond formation protein B [Mesopusillimonas faecipullorum]MCB5363124.1 disulfide bond formation protein B [Mesopusillimonas faecipullorum]
MRTEPIRTTLPHTTRLCLHLIAWLSLASVGVALVSQHVFEMPPCAWCTFQRLLYLCLTLICWLGLLIGRLHSLFGRIACALSALVAFGGVATAWYQHDVAANMVSCSQTFADRFMVSSGLDAGVPWLFGIYASCMDARVELFGVEYALWSLGLFVFLALLALVGLRARR